MHADPLMFYIDPTREGADSGLWIWLHNDRPAALLTVSIWPPGSRAQPLRFEAASLADEPVSIKLGEELRLLDEKEATRRSLPAEFAPSANPRVRLQQFKRLAKRFAATEDEVRGGPITLRLLSTPIYEALPADSASGCAVFAFAHGTNP